MTIRSARAHSRYFLPAAFLIGAFSLALASFEPRIVVTYLGGDERYLTHVTTDKPVYQAGETVYVGAYILHAIDHKPLAEDAETDARIIINGPQNQEIVSTTARSAKSVLGLSWAIPEGTAGGEYTVFVKYPTTGHPPAERRFEIRAYRVPRLKSQIEFPRKGYGPADSAVAVLQVERAEGGIPVGAKVNSQVRIDGRVVHKSLGYVDAKGHCVVKFTLPAKISRGEGTLSMAIDDSGVVETATQTVPILLKTLDLTCFPEGGELVAGVANRVYIQAWTPEGKPADAAGSVVDAAGATVGRFETFHEGRGVFQLKPSPGGKYSLKVEKPSGVTAPIPLPAVMDHGTVLRSLEPVYGAQDSIRVEVASPVAGARVVTLSQREAILTTQGVVLKSGAPAAVDLPVPAGVDGVLMITVWQNDGTPVAERLVFRKPAKALSVEVEPDRSSYVPADRMKLRVRTRDGAGAPVGAVVGLRVFDDAVLQMIEKRVQPPLLPVMVYLENEVKDLADAHVYFDAADPRAPQALDLLLGTQGWRRFAYIDPADFVEKHGDTGARLVAMREPVSAPEPETAFPEGKELAQGGAPRIPDAAAPQIAVLDRNAPANRVPDLADDRTEKAVKRAQVDVNAVRLAVRAEAVPAAPAAQRRVLRRRAEAPGGNQPEEDHQRIANKLMFPMDDRPFTPNEARFWLRGGAVPAIPAAVQAARPPNRPGLLLVREYAHEHAPASQLHDRRDFAQTVYWNAAVSTDAKSGEALVEFDLSDAVTGYRIDAGGFTADGLLGSSSRVVQAVEPFYVEPKLPLEVSTTDVLQIPIAIVNSSEGESGPVQIAFRGPAGLTMPPGLTVQVPPHSRERRVFELRPENIQGKAEIALEATRGRNTDRVTRSFEVKSAGFPIQRSMAGILPAGSAADWEVDVPRTMAPGSLETEVILYPSALANLSQSLEALVREPGGCFEQTSSTQYPMIMAQQFFQKHSDVDPELMRRCSEFLDHGYRRLLSYECAGGGFECFGHPPAQPVTTAFGLMEFRDLSKVQPIDETMFDRTHSWLSAQRVTAGRFEGGRIHGWQPSPQIATAYISWALQEAGEKLESDQLATVQSDAVASDNSFLMALGGLVLQKGGRGDDAGVLLDRLVAKQGTDGGVTGTVETACGGRGEGGSIETTSLAVLGWLAAGRYPAAVQRAIQFVASRCVNGRFGDTQSTTMALKAIIAARGGDTGTPADGRVELLVDGKLAVGAADLLRTPYEPIKFPSLVDRLTTGRHVIRLQMTAGYELPYSLSLRYHATVPDSSSQCRLSLNAEILDGTIQEGAATEIRVKLQNRINEPLPSPMAIIGVPGGCEPRPEQLKELVNKGIISAWEIRGRDVVLYWRDIAPNASVALPISLVAAVPGEYTGPASRCYEYYSAENKQWLEGLKIAITPKGSR